MGLSVPNLIGRTKGSLHNITFYQWKGLGIVRAKAASIKNPKTIKQQNNRLNLEPLIIAYRQIKPLLMRSLNFRPRNRFVYGQFLSMNLNKSVINGNFNFENFKISGEINEDAIFDYLRIAEGDLNIQLTWSLNINLYNLETDILCLVYVNELTKAFNYIFSNIPRTATQFKTKLNLGSELSKTFIYAFFTRADYSNSTKSSILEVIND